MSTTDEAAFSKAQGLILTAYDEQVKMNYGMRKALTAKLAAQKKAGGVKLDAATVRKLTALKGAYSITTLSSLKVALPQRITMAKTTQKV